MQENLALPHHEDRDREVSPGMLLSHGDEGTPQRLRLGTTLQNVFAEGVASARRRIGGGEEI